MSGATARSRWRGTRVREGSDDPPIARRSTPISTCRSTASARATARAASSSRACRWPYEIVSAYSANPSAFAIAAAVYESNPPLRRTTALATPALDSPRLRRPDVFMQLQLQPRGHTVLEHPFRKRLRIQDAVDRREQNRGTAPGEPATVDHVARELVVAAVLDHELHLIVRREAIEVRQVVARRLAAAGTFDVDDLHDGVRHAPDRTMAAGFEQHGSPARQQLVHQFVHVLMQKRLAAGDFEERTPVPLGLHHHLIHRHLPSLVERIRRIAPRTAQAARR